MDFRFGQLFIVPEVLHICYNTGTSALPDIYALALGHCVPLSIMHIKLVSLAHINAKATPINDNGYNCLLTAVELV